ncbi:TPA: hypothetical protein VAP34_001676 [Streptococcus agalactiae]|nr:hypothetical protein [Streptococcus agalactiae]
MNNKPKNKQIGKVLNQFFEIEKRPLQIGFFVGDNNEIKFLNDVELNEVKSLNQKPQYVYSFEVLDSLDSSSDANETSSVRTLIFEAHVRRLKELLSKLVDKTIAEAEFMELISLTDEIQKMMEDIFKEMNTFLLESNLIPKEEIEEIVALMHKAREDMHKAGEETKKNLKDLPFWEL